MRRTEAIASIVVIALGVAVMYYARTYLKLGMMISPGAGFLPFGVGAAFVVLGGVWLATTLLSPPSPAPTTEAAAESASDAPPAAVPAANPIVTRLVPGVLLVLAYAWLFERAGFFVSTVAFMVAWQKIVERERWGKTLLIALVCAGAMHALFSYLLKGVLPTGSWFG
jgi:hypothetical protein